MQPWLGRRADALVVAAMSVSGVRRPSINEYAKSHGSSSGGRAHHEVKIADAKALGDPPVGLVEHRGLFPDCSGLAFMMNLSCRNVAVAHQRASASTTACAKACGASWGKLCPMPPVMTRCEYLPVNLPA